MCRRHYPQRTTTTATATTVSFPCSHTVPKQYRNPTGSSILSLLILLTMSQNASPNDGSTNLRVFRQQISADQPEKNMNIGIIQVKLKHWSLSSTHLPPALTTAEEKRTPSMTTRTRRAWPITEKTKTVEADEHTHQHRRRWNNNVLQQQQKRTVQPNDAARGARRQTLAEEGADGALTWARTWTVSTAQAVNELMNECRPWLANSGIFGRNASAFTGFVPRGRKINKICLFPYLLLALGLALLAFFVILYAILNALLQRKDAQQNGEGEDEDEEERRRKRRNRNRRRRRRKRVRQKHRTARDTEEDEEWMGTEEDDEGVESEADSWDAEEPRAERRERRDEARNRAFTGLEEDELATLDDRDNGHAKWGKKKRHRQPLLDASPPTGESAADELRRQRRYRSVRRGQNEFDAEGQYPPPPPRGRPPPRPRHHIEWAVENGGAIGAEDVTAFRHDVPFPPPPPPRVPPPPPPLPARYERRRSRASAASDQCVSVTAHAHHRSHRPPPPPLRPPRGHGAPLTDEFSDMDSESVQSGRRGSGGERRQRTTAVRHGGANGRHSQQQLQQRPPLPLKRENTDSTVSSAQRGRTGSL
ncbi:hypothetical protein niasHT_011694 [Heterodera trifolii]|uniref:Uncharacterized protein n=1 Tax=Heterodera trifolii TaxID=157864 RepID=A0ABD2L504_9BILA